MTSPQPSPESDDRRPIALPRTSDDNNPPLELGFIAAKPKLLLTAIADHVDAWYWTRPWKSIALRLLGVMLLLGLTIGLQAASMLVRKEKLIRFYTSLLADPSAKGTAATGTTPGPTPSPSPKERLEEDDRTWSPGPKSQLSMLAARRLLQLNDTDPKAHFLIATDLGRAGKVDQARELMSKVSPPDGRGFAPGHAWLAASYIAPETAPRDPAGSKAKILHHLEQAMRWDGTTPQLRTIYAAELERAGDHQSAAQTLAKGVKQEPRLVNLLASIAYKNSQVASFRVDIDNARAALAQRIEQRTPSAEDLLPLISLAFVEGDLTQARSLIDSLAKLAPTDPRLPRLRSEWNRREYRRTFAKTPEGIRLSLELLDAALKADPTNPAIDAEINDLLAYGVEVPDDFKKFLQQKITDGKATALTHLILATNEVRSGAIAHAIPHLEIASRLAPGSVLIMNNLAYTLASADPAHAPRAMELIAAAVAKAPGDPNLLETQGEIFLIAGRPLDAAAALEKAIAIDNRRISSRKALAQAYAKAGLDDLASRQQEMIARLTAESDAKSSPPTPAPEPPTAPDPPVTPDSPTSADPPDRP